MKFPPHFSLEELTRSQTATRNNIDNSPNEDELNNLIKLAWWLESLRMRLRMKHKIAVIIVSSGFRCELLNTIIGGSPTSAHMQGLAADISCPDLTPLELAEFIRDNMADEGYDPHFGARPLRRVIQNRVEDVLSEGILAGTYQPGDTVRVDYQDGEVSLEVTAHAEPEAEIAEPEAVV